MLWARSFLRAVYDRLKVVAAATPWVLRRARWFLRVIAPYRGVITLVVMVAISAVVSRQFLTVQNITNIFWYAAVKGILAVGMTFVIITGGIDLSVAAILAAATCLAAAMVKPLEEASILPPLVACLLLGSVGGAVNGALVAWGRIQAFVVTLAMMSIARGVAQWLTGGYIISGGGVVAYADMLRGNLPIYLPGGVGLPIQAVIFVIVVLVGWLVLTRTAYGRAVYAIGGNEEAARLSGVRTSWVKISVYVICGLLAGLGGALQTAYNSSGSFSVGLGWELDAIAAVVVGGTSLMGGSGGVGGTFMGMLIIQMLSNVLNLKGVQEYQQAVVKGAIILVAVFAARREER